MLISYVRKGRVKLGIKCIDAVSGINLYEALPMFHFKTGYRPLHHLSFIKLRIPLFLHPVLLQHTMDYD